MEPGFADAVKSGMQREVQPPDTARAALVKRWIAAIEDAKKHWAPDFARMRKNMAFASGEQWPGQTKDDDRYQVNFVQRMLKASVSSMYAKNPTVVAKRRPRMDFTIWDGKIETLQGATQVLAQAGMTGVPPDQEAMALLADVQQGVEKRAMMDKLGKTLEILCRYFIDELEPDFKAQMKQMVRRTRTTGVGYIEVGFQRQMELTDDQSSRIYDMSEQLAAIGRMQADIQDGEVDPDASSAEELRLAIQAIQQQPEVIVREGVIWHFPQSTRIIPAPETQKLIGWVGCPWLAKEIILTPDRVKEVYGVDPAKGYTAYKPDLGKPQGASRAKARVKTDKSLCCVWHIFDKSTGLEYVVMDGYPDFLQEPAAPAVLVEQFFPIYALTLNEVEDEDRLFPASDVENIKHIQKEYNRVKEAMRQHRIANRPLYLTPSGQFDEGEEKNLASHAAHDVIEVKALRDGVKVTDLLAPVQKIGVDPNLYETEGLFRDLSRVTGFQEANLGGTSNGTATESSIAQGSLQGSTGLDADDLDEMLSRVMRAAGQIMLTELSIETVKEIAGDGAVWPQASRLDVMKEIGLEVKAGSSGRPNQAQDAARLERMYPLLIQVPGISPRWLAELAIGIADDDVDLSDAILDGLPSIVAQNALAQPAPGNPANNPTAQGGAPGPAKTPPAGGTSQPGFPAGPQPNQVHP